MDFLDLIRAYLAASTTALEHLKLELGKDFSGAEHPKGYPHQLADGSEYQFHGIGCRFTDSFGVEVDFDFDPSGGASGFDAWRLWQFGKQFQDKYIQFQNLTVVEDELKNAISNGRVRSSKVKSDSLYYLA